MDEQQARNLIMRDLPSPSDSQAMMIGDSPEQVLARHMYGVQVKEKIKLKKGKSTFSESQFGKSKLKYWDDGELHEVEVTIRCIPFDIMQVISRNQATCIAKFPMVWDEDRKEYMQDFYQEGLEDVRVDLVLYQAEMELDKVLYGVLDLELYDEDDNLIWSITQNHTPDIQAARKALYEMGVTPEHAKPIARDIDALMGVVATRERETDRKK